MKKLLAATSLCIASLSAHAVIAVPEYSIDAGQKIVETNCAACHGLNGVSIVPSQPNLAGQNVRYLYKQLVEFKTGERVNGIMAAQVSGLSQQDLANVAGYYAAQKPWGAFAGDPATTAEATKIYLGGDGNRGVIPCAGCHGPKAGGNDYAAFPRLSGQHEEYLGIQLKMFRAAGRQDDISGDDQKRVNDPAKMMQTVAARLSDRDIRILADYLSAVH